MTATYKAVTGGKVSVAFTFTAPTQVVVDTATAAAQYLYKLTGGDPGTFATLTDQQKLDIIDAHLHLLTVIQNLARTQHSLVAQEAARVAADTEGLTKFI